MTPIEIIRGLINSEPNTPTRHAAVREGAALLRRVDAEGDTAVAYDAMEAFAEAAYRLACEKGWHRAVAQEELEIDALREAVATIDDDRSRYEILKQMLQDRRERLALCNGVDIPAELALIHEEVSEALQAYRDPQLSPKLAYSRNQYDEVVERAHGDAWNKPEGFAAELADVVIRCFKLARAVGAPLVSEIKRKMAYNAQRPHRHGGKRL